MKYTAVYRIFFFVFEKKIFYNKSIGGCSSTVERQLVELSVAGSNPVSHPKARITFSLPFYIAHTQQ